MSFSSGNDSQGSFSHSMGGGSMMAEINVTPLVDVMLVLLIIFMVTTPLLQQGVEVALPKASAPGLKAEESSLIIAIKADEKIYMANAEVSIKQLETSLTAVVKNNPTKQVFLKADKMVPYGTVALVMATVKTAGVTRLGMVTQPGDQGSQ